MAKWQNDDMLNEALAYLLNIAGIYLCSQQPSSYTEATSTYSLGGKAVSSSVVGAPSNETDGRSCTISGSSIGEITVTAAGNATHVAVVSSANLLFVTTCDTKTLYASDTLEISDIKVTVKDAT
jgi:hypothetical protein